MRIAVAERIAESFGRKWKISRMLAENFSLKIPSRPLLAVKIQLMKPGVSYVDQFTNIFFRNIADTLSQSRICQTDYCVYSFQF